MVALMAGIAIVMILSTVAVQGWSDVVRRDNEAEMIFRAQDIVRAIHRYKTDKGKLPNQLKELMEPGQKGQYFLRQLWKDPLVKGGAWQLVYWGPAGGLFDPSAPGIGGPPQVGQQAPGPNGNLPQGVSDIRKKDDGSSETTGLPIAGVKTRCSKPPFRLYKEKTEYNEWIFSILDIEKIGPTNTNPQQ